MDDILSCDEQSYSAEFPNFAQPREIGHFSKNSEKSLTYDKSQLQILNKCALEGSKIFFDLNEGLDRLIEKPHERLENLLRWILHVRREKLRENCHSTPTLKEILFNTDFVSWRGLLTRVASTLYKSNEGWIVCICKFQDIYFLCEFDTALKKQQYECRSDREKLMTFWGHRFEHYVTIPPEKTDFSAKKQIVDLNEEFSLIVRTKLQENRLIFGAEIDCVDPIIGDFVELKTNVKIETAKQQKTFERFKSVSWWLQSFLIGIDRIICGYRDNDGIVKSVKEIKLTEIVKQSQNFWSGAKCFNFLANILNSIRQRISLDDSSAVYKFEYDPVKKRLSFKQDFDPDHQFLPDWFVAEIRSIR